MPAKRKSRYLHKAWYENSSMIMIRCGFGRRFDPDGAIRWTWTWLGVDCPRCLLHLRPLEQVEMSLQGKRG